MWYELIVDENNITLLGDRVLDAEVGTFSSLRDFLLDGSELFLKISELGAVFRFIIPTL